jgi:hypothetical protein
VLEDLGIEIRKYDQPIELVLASEDKVPGHIGAFLSSALYNIHIMSGDGFVITSFRFPDKYITPDRQAWANEIYSFLAARSSENLRIVNLN